jgi:hypothetical protein
MNLKKKISIFKDFQGKIEKMRIEFNRKKKLKRNENVKKKKKILKTT